MRRLSETLGQGHRAQRLGPAQRFRVRRNVLLHGELGPMQFLVPPNHSQQFLVCIALHEPFHVVDVAGKT